MHPLIILIFTLNFIFLLFIHPIISTLLFPHIKIFHFIYVSLLLLLSSFLFTHSMSSPQLPSHYLNYILPTPLTPFLNWNNLNFQTVLTHPHQLSSSLLSNSPSSIQSISISISTHITFLHIYNSAFKTSTHTTLLPPFLHITPSFSLLLFLHLNHISYLFLYSFIYKLPIPFIFINFSIHPHLFSLYLYLTIIHLTYISSHISQSFTSSFLVKIIVFTYSLTFSSSISTSISDYSLPYQYRIANLLIFNIIHAFFIP